MTRTHDLRLPEAACYLLSAVLALGYVHYAAARDPVAYVRLVTEDQWGEFSTAICFAFTGVFLLFLACSNGGKLRRTLWALMGLGALFVAGEEISWGQRMFGLSVPEVLRGLSLQNEITIHNLAAAHRTAVLVQGLLPSLVLAWTAVSAALWLTRSERAERLATSGVPIVPLRLTPVFLTVPSLTIVPPLVANYEIREMLLAFAAFAFSVDLLNRFGAEKAIQGRAAVLVFVISLVLVGAASLALEWKFSKAMVLRWRTNHEALGYCLRGQDNQANLLYEFMTENPIYLDPYSRIGHAVVLRRLGEDQRAIEVLASAARHEETLSEGSTRVEHLRRQGVIARLRGENAEASGYLTEAARLTESALALTDDPDKQAELLLSLARTLEAGGDLGAAHDKAAEVLTTAASPVLQQQARFSVEWLDSAGNAGLGTDIGCDLVRHLRQADPDRRSWYRE